MCSRCGTGLVQESAFCHRCGQSTGLPPLMPSTTRLPEPTASEEGSLPWDAADPNGVLRWMQSEFPDARFSETDAATFNGRFDQSPAPDRRTAAQRIAKRMALKKSGHRPSKSRHMNLLDKGSRQIIQNRRAKLRRNLPTISDKVPKVEPLPPLKSMAQDPTSGTPPWHHSSPGGSVEGRRGASPCIHGMVRYNCGYCTGSLG
jgi:hypothetical protein